MPQHGLISIVLDHGNSEKKAFYEFNPKILILVFAM